MEKQIRLGSPDEEALIRNNDPDLERLSEPSELLE
jgi:hypothetical protein